MALNWQTIEQAIVAWVTGNTSLNSQHIRWAYPDAVIPSRPLLVLTWQDRDNPVGISVQDAVMPVVGNPSATQAWQHSRTHTLQIDWLALVPTSKTGANDWAPAALGTLLRTLQLDSVRSAFLAAGIGLQGISAVQDLTSIVETSYESRAIAQITINTVDQTLEQAGKITTVLPPTGTIHT